MRHRLVAPIVLVLSLTLTHPLSAQEPTPETGPRDARRGSQFLIPLGSLAFPGFGQYMHGALLPGAGYTGAALVGAVIGETANGEGFTLDEVRRNGRDQLAYEGQHVVLSAGFLSAWDAFHRAVPVLQQEGKYRFLTTRETLDELLTAPFDVEFLGRWTTWVDLAFTGIVAGWVLADRDRGVAYEPFRARDAAFLTSLSYNAAVGEEAAFRGWLLPLFHQTLGGAVLAGEHPSGGDLRLGACGPGGGGSHWRSSRRLSTMAGSRGATTGASASRSSITSGTT
jgi:hypothetical protein